MGGEQPTPGRRLAIRGTRRFARRLSLGVSIAVLALLATAGAAAAATFFSKVPGTMVTPRYTPAAGLLPDGRVLIAGGFATGAVPQKSAEVYDPATGKFELLAAELPVAFGEMASVSLPDGSVILIGGWSKTTESLKTAVLFNPVTQSFEKVGSEMTIERDGPGAVLLPSGKVFITGGSQNTGPNTLTAETYDPATRTFSPVKGLATEGRYQPAVALLPTGKVLIVGGGEVSSAELYDPASETFQKLEGVGHVPVEPREEAGAVTLQNGKVLLAGGTVPGGEARNTAEVFDATNSTFTKLPDLLAEGRDGERGVLLPDGRALFIGGYNGGLPELATRWLNTVEITSVPAAAPTTVGSSAVGITTANIAGSALTEARTRVFFQYGPTPGFEKTTTPQTIGFTGAPQGVSASLTGLLPATTYYFRLVAENAGGTTYGATQSFTTAPPVPALGSVKQAHSLWREGNGLAQVARRRVPVGTTFSFALNTPAKVTLAFTQKVGGRRVHGRCVAKTHRNRRARHCTRTVTRGTLAVNGHVGTNTVKFQGRISRAKKLRPGTYTLVITASGPSGAAAAQKLTFTIVR